MLEKIPEKLFAITGVIVGCGVSVLILLQIIKELQSKLATSSLSVWYVLGLLGVYLFWLAYGIRLKNIALIVGNSLASTLQAILLLIILFKY